MVDHADSQGLAKQMQRKVNEGMYRGLLLRTYWARAADETSKTSDKMQPCSG